MLLYDEPLAQVTELRQVADNCYRIRFCDRRDGRTHTVLEVAQVVARIDSICAGRVLQPDFGVCEVCVTACMASATHKVSSATCPGRA